MPPLFFVGLALFAAGFLVIFAVLAAHGGLAKAQTFTVIGALPPRSKRVLLGALVVCGLGGLSTCSAVAMGDAKVRQACVDDCKRAGHADGRIGPASSPASGQQRPTPACWCTRGAASVELRPAR